MRRNYVSALLAVGVATAQPALAAGDFPQVAASDHRPAAFGGFTVRIPLGQKAAAKPEARLQLTTYKTASTRSSDLRAFNPNGLELGMSKAGKPMLFSGGQNTAEVKQKMRLSTTSTVVIVGGVILLVAVVAAAASSSAFPDCEPYEGNDDHCID